MVEFTVPRYAGWYNGHEIMADAKMAKTAWVEVQCGTNHHGVFWDGRMNCRYVRVFYHECHKCNGLWLMKATTPPEQQRCNNCQGPAQPTRGQSCWPDLVVLLDFIDPRPDQTRGVKEKEE